MLLLLPVHSLPDSQSQPTHTFPVPPHLSTVILCFLFLVLQQSSDKLANPAAWCRRGLSLEAHTVLTTLRRTNRQTPTPLPAFSAALPTWSAHLSRICSLWLRARRRFA
ncbi:hypothetical protein BDV06DRAFT_165541 [Aspergillus oleicola]